MKKYLLLCVCAGFLASAEAKTKTDWTVTLAEVPRTLTAHIAADSKYWLWINGRMVVFEGGLKRGPSPYDTYYDSVEIAPYLTSGENTIAVLVWHFGKNSLAV